MYVKAVIEIEAEGYEPLDLKFTVDTSTALELFAGNRLYTDKRVFLRELVQNAVDACNLRKIFDPGAPSSITISFRESENRISIRDNGIGMDRQWIEKYFMNIGISFYRSDEFCDAMGTSDLRFSFISTFGIGFLSTFLVAARIRIRTRKPSGKGLAITIADFFDVTDVDDDLYNSLHQEVRDILQQRFRAFIRTCVSRVDLVSTDFVSITESHGFHHEWQKAVLDNTVRNLRAVEMDHNAE